MDFLNEVGPALRGVNDPNKALRIGAEYAVSALADFAVALCDPGIEGERRLQVVHAESTQEDRVTELVEQLLVPIRATAARHLARGRDFRWVPTLSEASLGFLRETPELARALYGLNVRSIMVVPLRSMGRTFGGMALCRTRGTPFHATDLAAAQVLARRTATAVESASLYEQTLDEQIRRARLEALLNKWIRVFDLAGWGAAIVDGADQRIEEVNPAFARLHGYSDANFLVGRLYTDLLLPEQREEPQEWILSSEPVQAYESVHLRADGTPFPVLTDVTTLQMGEAPLSFVVTVQDLTELKRTEERLRRAQRLEAVGRLAGGVAHEVNNMMTIILGFSDLLARAAHLPQERARELEEIHKAAARAGNITKQLLAFSRKQLLQPGQLEINGVISELAPMLRLLLPANIELQTELAPLTPVAHADRAQLEQVIVNLVFNARDAMAEGGTLAVATGSRRLDEQDGKRLIGIPIPAGEYAQISVVDTGHGMDQTTLMQVFEPFFTTKPVGTGTGLGLATVYGIVKQSGGYVWIESTPGAGTTVTVSLPEVERRVAAPRPAEPTPAYAECRSGTVLVVEDEEGVRELVLRVLDQQGHRVIQAQDGVTAVSLLRERGGELDLVLWDVIVPGISTPELEREIRDVRPNLPILYMSGYSRDEVIERGLIEPERCFLQKPFSAAELSRLVCQQLEAAGKPVVAR